MFLRRSKTRFFLLKMHFLCSGGWYVFYTYKTRIMFWDFWLFIICTDWRWWISMSFSGGDFWHWSEPFFCGSKKWKSKKSKKLYLAFCWCARLFYNEKSQKYKNAFLDRYAQKYNNLELWKCTIVYAEFKYVIYLKMMKNREKSIFPTFL